MHEPDRPSDPISHRLDSWKEIASFFGRDERTVRRWERERSLPVHRMPGKQRGSVYAYSEELSQWLNAPLFPRDEMQEGVPQEITRSRSKSLRFAFAGFVALVLILGAAWYIGKSVLSASRTPVASHSPNPEALDLYLKGRFEWSKRTPDGLNKAVDLFTQAVVRDPNYAQAYTGLADSYTLLREYTDMPSQIGRAHV
jgi:hypothetical protein